MSKKELGKGIGRWHYREVKNYIKVKEMKKRLVSMAQWLSIGL